MAGSTARSAAGTRPPTVQRFTPRTRRSAWSKRNTGMAERLIAEGRMQPAGLAAVEAARADGRWAAAYAGPATSEVPADLAEALAANPRAQAMFAILTSQNRYAILYRLNTSKRPDTRARRIPTSWPCWPGARPSIPRSRRRARVRPAGSPELRDGSRTGRRSIFSGPWLLPRLCPPAGSGGRRQR